MEKENGSYKRAPSRFRNVIEQGGRFPPETDRYHLYVSYACPWASRTLIMRKLKGLEFIGVTVVSPRMGPDGWPFAPVDDYPGAEPDPLYNSRLVKDLYLRADPGYVGKYTVPVLWDKKQHTIVNNESADITRMFNYAFNDGLPAHLAALDFYPPELRGEIDALEAWMYDDINNGVYKVGFAATFSAYRDALLSLFDALDRIENMLSGKVYLVGDRLTEADIRLYVTMVRFDVAYVGRFNCNIRTVRGGYPNIHLWLRRLYWKHDAFQSTTDFQHIKTGYYSLKSMRTESPFVPIGPVPHIEPL
ncbi:glutathione S-transferase [Dentipellis sp. KUC8613]|nr:glutathione S-transferase [Dentipellis sp. KUC8613]